MHGKSKTYGNHLATLELFYPYKLQCIYHSIRLSETNTAVPQKPLIELFLQNYGTFSYQLCAQRRLEIITHHLTTSKALQRFRSSHLCCAGDAT